MADLASLRAEARGKLTCSEVEVLVLRTWGAALDSVRSRAPADLTGCGDNSCIVAKPRGMATNGGYAMTARRSVRSSHRHRAEIERMLAQAARDGAE